MALQNTKLSRGVIAKDGNRLRTLEDWQCLASPKSPIHWKDNRSAKENARRWLESTPHLPSEIAGLLLSCGMTGTVGPWCAEPEARVSFDEFRGEPANIDMLVRAEDDSGPIVICIEAKVDETFGETVERTLSEAEKRLEKSPKSKGVERLERLAKIFRLDLSRREVLNLRYQLLTLTAATIAEAHRQSAKCAMAIVHEFMTPLVREEHRDRNASDLDDFLRIVLGSTNSLGSGMVMGPFQIGGINRLYFGKAATDRVDRSNPAG